MERPKIFVTDIFLKKYLQALEEKYDVVVYPGKNITRVELLEGVSGSTAIVSLLTEKIDAEVMEVAGNKLKAICNFAVGYDNIDVEEATKRGICVTNTPGVLTESVAEHVIALMFALFRRVVEGDRMIRLGGYKGWEPDLLLGTGVKDKVLGIIGLGRIGRWTARLANAVGMKVIYFNRTRNLEFEEEVGVVYHGLEKLLELSDVVSVSLALSVETKHFITLMEMSLMKKTALLINTARGSIVKETDLIEALEKGLIAGAGLDVFENELEIPKQLLRANNVVLTPHIASATVEARLAMARVLINNLRDVLDGQQPACLVNYSVNTYEQK